MKKFAIASLRVSSEKQGLIGDSFDDQKEKIKQRAEQLSSILASEIIITKWFEYTQSASGEIDVQPIQEAINYCKDPKNKIDYFFIRSIDRFTRGGSTIYGTLKMQLAKYGVDLIDCYGIISNEKINTLSHLGIQYPWSVYSPSQTSEMLEAERTKSEVRDILTRMIGAEVRYVRMGYRVRAAPPGYRNVKIDTPQGTRVILEAEPTEAPWFIKMFELRAKGVIDEEIVKEINNLGYKSRKFKRHDPIDKKKIIGFGGEKPLTVKELQRKIQNPIYAGINVEKWTVEQPIKGRFKGLVSVDMFNKANRGKVSILENNGQIRIVKNSIPPWRVTRLKNNPIFAFKKSVLCHICFEPLLGSSPRSKLGKHIPRYHCSRNHKYWSVNKTTFNNTISNFVSKIKFSKSFTDKFNKIVIEEWNKREKEMSKDAVLLGNKVAEKEQETQVLKDKIKYLSSPITIKMFEEDIERLQIEKANLVETRDDKEKNQLDIETIINFTCYYMEHLDKLILSGSNPLQNAAMFDLLFEATPTYKELVNGTPKLSPIFALSEALNTSEKQFVTPPGFEPGFTG